MIILTIIIFVVNLHTIYGQNELLSCRYFEDSTYGYTCDLNVRNANGLSNFTSVNGTHLSKHDNDDVMRIYSYANRSASSNVPSILCEQFPNTVRIFLRDITIQKIENSFIGCKNAISIELPNNRIINFSETSFVNNSKLQTLSLNNNDLISLPEKLFAVQGNLVHLILFSNKIKDLPRNIFKELTKLKELNLANNLLVNLKIEWFRYLESLELLYLYSNQIIELPSYIFINLNNLKRIDLYSNKLMMLHADSFGVLLKLTQISVHTNSLNYIDERLIDNTEVTSFDVRTNICANINLSDTTATRITMRNSLRPCLNNYLNLVSVCRHQKNPPHDEYPYECTSGDYDKRICSIEKQNDKFENTILSEIRSENQKVLMALEDVNTRLTELENRPSACN